MLKTLKAKKYDLIIFDLDGVLVDTEKTRWKILKDILKEYDLQLDEKEFYNIIGKRTDQFVKEKFPKLKKPDIEKIMLKRRKVQQEYYEKQKVFSEMKKSIQILFQTNKLAIATGSQKNKILSILKYNNLEKYFKNIFSGEEFTHSKPDKECYVKACRKFHVSPKDVLVIEDSILGIMSAKSARCNVLGIAYYYNWKNLDDKTKKLFQFRTHKEFLDFIAKK